ncbi:MAG: hypothetical protein ABJP34_05815 [Erythrobacter sp.]
MAWFSPQGAGASLFEPLDEGFAYFPNQWSKGYLVSKSEREVINSDLEKLTSFKTVLFYVLGFFAMALAIHGVVFALKIDLPFESLPELSAVIVGVAVLIWKLSSTHHSVRDRKPTIPRRTMTATDKAAGQSVSWLLLIWMWVAVIPGFLLFGALFAFSYPWLWVPYVLISSLTCYRIAAWTYFKFRASKED